jgi:hypothetical protein
MSALEKIKAKLAKHPHVTAEYQGGSIVVPASSPKGFDVTFVSEHTAYLVSFDGWHEHFMSEDEAIACFGFGLSSRCRLAITFRGPTPVQWTVESERDGQWTRDSVTGLFFSPFWRAKRIEYRRNTFF